MEHVSTTLQLDPDRLFPADPATRDVARGLYESVARAADHLAARPRRADACCSMTSRSPIRPSSSSRTTTTSPACCTPQASTSPTLGVGGSGPADPRRGVAHLRRATGTCSPAPSSGYWLTHELATLFDIRTSRRPRRRTPLYDAIAPRLGRPGVPPARAVRALRHRGARDHRRPDGRPRRACGARRRPDVHRSRAADVPPRRLPRPGRAGLRAPASSGSPRRTARHPTTSPATSPRSRRDGRTSSRTAPSRPITACASRTPSTSATTRRPRLYRRAVAGDLDAAGAREFARQHAAAHGGHERARRARHDDPPRRLPQPLERDVRRGSGPTPATTSRSRRRTPRICARCSSATASSPACTSCSSRVDETVYSREVAPLAGLLPERLHRRAVVVPRRTRRGAAVPRRPSPRPQASTAARASSTTPAPSSPSRRATTWLADSTRRSSRGSCARAASRRSPPSASSSTSSTPIPRRVFKL